MDESFLPGCPRGGLIREVIAKRINDGSTPGALRFHELEEGALTRLDLSARTRRSSVGAETTTTRPRSALEPAK